MTEDGNTLTMETVEKLRAIADELESLADRFPHLTWYRAFHESLWNGNRRDLYQRSLYYRVMVDEANVGQATGVSVGPNHAGAFVELDSLNTDISVLYIQGLQLCKLSHTRDELVEVIQMLPEHLRLPIYERMARIRKKDRREKREKKEQLRRELERLEGSH